MGTEEAVDVYDSAVQPPSPPAEPAIDVIKPPNGGLRAWLQVFAAFWVYFNTWGLIVTFGVSQTYLETHILSDHSPSSISWIGTMQSFLLIEVGIISGPLFDKGYIRILMAVGAILLPLGFLMASLAKTYASLFLSLGVCTGLGMGLLFFPAVTVITSYFTTRRALANGIAASGSAIGAVIYPIIVRQLINDASFAWALRTVGFIALATTIVPILLVKPLVLSGVKKKPALKEILADLPFTLFSLTNFIGWLGVQIPLIYGATFAEVTPGIQVSQSTAFYTLAIIGAGSLPGRLLAPLLGNPLVVYPSFMALAGILSLAWIRVSSYAGLVVITLLYGFAYGGIVSLPPPAVGVLTREVGQIGTRIGLAFSVAGVSTLVGPPIAGAIEGGRGGFKGLFGFAGAMMLAGSVCLAGVAILHGREVKKREKESSSSENEIDTRG